MLTFGFRDDPMMRSLYDQFMMGRLLMICSVTEPGARTRWVYLLDGAEWCDFWKGERLSGGRWIDADAPLELISLYVCAEANRAAHLP